MKINIRLIAVLLITCCVTSLMCGASAQSLDAAPHSRLAVAIAGVSGEHTIKDVFEEIGKQTGIKVIGSASLTERTLILTGKPVPAETLLGNICDVNDYAWRQTAPDRILIERRAANSNDGLQGRILASVPADCRAYITSSAIQPEERQPGKPFTIADKMHLQQELASASGEQKRNACMAAAVALRSAVEKGCHNRKLLYSTLTSEQQHMLIRALALTALREMSKDGGCLRNLLPCFKDPTRLYLECKDGGISLSHEELENGLMTTTGFGSAITGTPIPEADLMRAVERIRQFEE